MRTCNIFGWGTFSDTFAISLCKNHRTLIIYIKGDYNKQTIGGCSLLLPAPNCCPPIAASMCMQQARTQAAQLQSAIIRHPTAAEANLQPSSSMAHAAVGEANARRPGGGRAGTRHRRWMLDNSAPSCVPPTSGCTCSGVSGALPCTAGAFGAAPKKPFR